MNLKGHVSSESAYSQEMCPRPDSKSRSSMLASLVFVFESLLGICFESVQASLQNMAKQK